MAGGSEFRFEETVAARVNGRSFYWRMPSDLRSANELFAAYAEALWLPDDRHPNWALLCARLCDLEWISDRTIMIVHEALPSLPEAELRAYLATLRDAVRWWRDDDLHRKDDPHVLEVVFPANDRGRIAALLG